MPLKDSKLRYGPEHVNSNILCALDIRVGGLDPSCSDLLEVCFVPLNHSFKLHTEFNLFNVKIRPSWPVNNRVAKLNHETVVDFVNSSHDGQGALTIFEYWCENVLQLKLHKQVMPLCYDWGFIKPFLKNWMGEETFELLISDSVRDIQTVMNFTNDRHAYWGDEVPYPIIRESQLYKRSGISLIEKNSLPANCKGLLDTYGQMLKSFMPGHACSPHSQNG